MALTGVNATWRMPDEHVYDGQRMPGLFAKKTLDMIKSFEFRETDVLLDSFPKSGTTWVQEIMYLIHNQADTAKAKAKPVHDRSPFLEKSLTAPGGPEQVKNLPDTRILLTHVPIHFIKDKIVKDGLKTVYILRNPKDTLVSLYHFMKVTPVLGAYPGTWDDFFELCKTKDFFYGDWLKHVESFWQHRHLSNVLIVKYEDLKEDLDQCVRLLANYSGITLTEEQIESIGKHCSFGEMSQNKSVSQNDVVAEGAKFVRKGQIGDWKNYFTDEQNQYIEGTYGKKLKEMGLELRFE